MNTKRYDDGFYDEDIPSNRRSRFYSCSDGFCGAEDCPRCRPLTFNTAEDPESEAE